MYNVPAKTCQTELLIRKSRFIARAAHVTRREQAMATLTVARSDYPDANHHCWAYVFGPPRSARGAAMSDDGEPSGTAGKPILNVLQHKDIGDVMIIVARYFGGIKLGAGGLVRAYTGAAQHVIETLPVKLLVDTRRYSLTVDYAGEQYVRHWLSQHTGSIVTHNYREAMHCVIELPVDQHDSLIAAAGANHWKLDTSTPSK